MNAILHLLFSLSTLRTAHSACDHDIGQGTRDDIKEKYRGDEPSGGSTYAKGGRANGLHVYHDEQNSAEAQAKISVHEYMHVIQQGFLNEELNTTRGPVHLKDPSQQRFQLINLCNLSTSAAQEHLDALNALPDDIKLFDVPTFVILYPYNYDTNTPGCLASKIDEYTNSTLTQIYGSNCENMIQNENGWSRNENRIFAEGEAEY